MEAPFTKIKEQASEDDHAIALYDWAEYARVRLPSGEYIRVSDHLWHIPNEGKRSVQMNVKLKKMGLVAGALDYTFAVPIGNYHGLFFDLKKIGGRTNEKQIKFANSRKAMGYYADPKVEGWEAARDLILKYITMEL